MNLVLELGESSGVHEVFKGGTHFGDQEVVQNDCHEVYHKHENDPECEVNMEATVFIICHAFKFRSLEISGAASEQVDIAGGVITNANLFISNISP
jgi:hypothetical protein